MNLKLYRIGMGALLIAILVLGLFLLGIAAYTLLVIWQTVSTFIDKSFSFQHQEGEYLLSIGLVILLILCYIVGWWADQEEKGVPPGQERSR